MSPTSFRPSVRKIFLTSILFVGLVCALKAQSGNCSTQGNSSIALPRYSETLPNVLSTGGNANNLYVLTHWGFARASLADPANPAGFSLLNVGNEAGYDHGGLINVLCDCHTGGVIMAAAEAPDGSARTISDWAPASRGFGLPGQIARADGAGSMRYGQQVDLSTIPGKIAAIHSPAAQKYFGYFSTGSSGIQVVDLTTTSGNTTVGLRPSSSLSWTGTTALTAARVQAAGGYDELLLAGSTDTGQTIRIARINPSTGAASELATAPTTYAPVTVALGVVSGRIFIFSAEQTAGGLRIYEFVPSQFGGSISPAGSIPGNYDLVVVKGDQFPVIFAHRTVAFGQSFVDVYGSKFLIQGGAPVKAASLAHFGSTEVSFRRGLEAVVKTVAGVPKAYVYRLLNATAVGDEELVRTDVVDLSCIAADPTAPPAAGATLTNLSKQSRGGIGPDYFGDRWRVQNSSSSAVALDQIEWDWNVASLGSPPTPTFQADAALSGPLPNTTLTDFNPAYFPCDPSGPISGDPRSGTNCYGSVGSPLAPAGADYRIGIRSHNANGWSGSPFISPAITIQVPAVRIAGFSAGSLRVLSGGQADASGSDGNVADATFNWTFLDSSGGTVGTAQTPRATVPSAATSFRLTVAYAGGYVPSLNGTIQQVDLVPDFAINPTTVLNNSKLRLTNRMQIGNATLNSVEYAIASTATVPATFSGTLAATFLAVNGIDSTTVTAPSTCGTTSRAPTVSRSR